jgi:hypothetical protein
MAEQHVFAYSILCGRALQQAFAATTTANVNYENLLDGGVVDDSYESLRNAYRDRPEEYNAYGSAYSALVAHTPASMPFITRYNDAPERTHKEILALYDAAIASLP